MALEKSLRRILGPFVFLFGLCILAGYAWILITEQDKSADRLLFGAIFAVLFSSIFIFVGIRLDARTRLNEISEIT